MSSLEDVLWEPAQFVDEKHVRLCVDGREMRYDSKYMRSSGAWFRSSQFRTIRSKTFSSLFKETDAIFKEFSHQVSYFSKILKMVEIRSKKSA